MAESKIEDVLVKYFDEMPKWLKNMTVIFIILGIVYFGFVRNYIYNNTNSNSIELLQEDVEKLEMKVKELESERNKADNKGDDGKAKKAQEEIDRLINEFKVKEDKYLSDLSAKEREKQEAISNFKEELLDRKSVV